MKCVNFKLYQSDFKKGVDIAYITDEGIRNEFLHAPVEEYDISAQAGAWCALTPDSDYTVVNIKSEPYSVNYAAATFDNGDIYYYFVDSVEIIPQDSEAEGGGTPCRLTLTPDYMALLPTQDIINIAPIYGHIINQAAQGNRGIDPLRDGNEARADLNICDMGIGYQPAPPAGIAVLISGYTDNGDFKQFITMQSLVTDKTTVNKQFTSWFEGYNVNGKTRNVRPPFYAVNISGEGWESPSTPSHNFKTMAMHVVPLALIDNKFKGAGATGSLNYAVLYAIAGGQKTPDPAKPDINFLLNAYEVTGLQLYTKNYSFTPNDEAREYCLGTATEFLKLPIRYNNNGIVPLEFRITVTAAVTGAKIVISLDNEQLSIENSFLMPIAENVENSYRAQHRTQIALQDMAGFVAGVGTVAGGLQSGNYYGAIQGAGALANQLVNINARGKDIKSVQVRTDGGFFEVNAYTDIPYFYICVYSYPAKNAKEIKQSIKYMGLELLPLNSSAHRMELFPTKSGEAQRKITYLLCNSLPLILPEERFIPPQFLRAIEAEFLNGVRLWLNPSPANFGILYDD